MQINTDFTRPVTIRGDRYHWVPSTQTGVERMMLDRIGDEKARATTVVRYSLILHFLITLILGVKKF
ncbi:cupin domain-containing protein [Photobacterium angustum]|uniref:cupin domain-containing protein n=1 Tax=Photobacterium angustum TaxID=661 RepID=UPI000B32042E